MAFSPDYVRLVLNENFEDAKTFLLAPLMAIHYAHLAMLAEQGIVSRPDARAIRDALDGIDQAQILGVAYDGSYEDLYFYVDRLIADGCGADVAGRLHTARSRNDIDMTMYRMRLREFVLGVVEATLALRQALVDQASRHERTIFAAHTHGQPAQPTTVAHYLLGVVEQLERDTTRLLEAYRSTNRSPLGACAITGTGFGIDRQRTSALLGFSGPTGNTYGSIATVDYLLEGTAASSILLVGVGRFVQDMLLWCTREVGYLRLPDGFVQASSIMPQKRNPVALEHARALASKAMAQATAVGLAIHNTPFGDIVDTEDDIQPLVASAFRDAVRAVTLVAAAMKEASFDVEAMASRAARDWVTVTEVADMLVRNHGLPFKVAHEISGVLVETCQRNQAADMADVVNRAARARGLDLCVSADAVAQALSAEHFVAVRRTHGGPAPEMTHEAVERSRELLEADTARLAALRASVAAASVAARRAVDAL